MNDSELNAAATQLAHGYLLELLLGQLVNRMPDQAAVIEQLRFSLAAQVHDDFARGLHTGTQGNADLLKASVSRLLGEILDRAASHYCRTAQPIASA